MTVRAWRSVRARVVRAAAVALLAAGCGSGAGTSSQPPALRLLTAAGPVTGTDTFEVWVCHVPDSTTDPIYLSGGARLRLTPHDVAARLEASVPGYFADLSGGAYRPTFVVGGELTIGPADGHQDCIDRALDTSGDDADAAYVVADAEHGADVPGGLAQPGSGCDCPARESQRMVYVGASDFHPSWGTTPAVDLTEHEIGHTIGLPHSGDVAPTVDTSRHAYSSALDVMSNSAAPRDTDPARRHGPATIAANLLALGWLPSSAAVLVAQGGADVTLTPANLGSDRVAGATRSLPRTRRVAVVPLDEFRLLTVELLAPIGFDDHLPAAGIVVHLVDQSPSACGHTAEAPCTGLDRRQLVLGSVAPHTDLLTTGEHLDAEGWRIEVRAISADGASATLALRPTQR